MIAPADRRELSMRPRTMSVEQKDRLVRQLQDLLQGRSEILFALLHGSFLTDVSFRDVDLALSIDPGAIGSETLRGYEVDLGIRFSAAVGMPVDVRVLNDAPVAFRYHALKGKALLVRETDFLDEFRARTWDDYCDFAPFARRYLRKAVGD